LNLWLYNQDENKRAVNEHFYYVGQQYLQQNSTALLVLLQQDKKLLQAYVEQLSLNEGIKSVHVYDTSGQIIAVSSNENSINDLYGISIKKLNKSNEFVPFATELRDDELRGYVRLTLAENYLTDNLLKSSEQQYGLIRLMMIIAGVVGFLLTRGLNRFSRQGFRLAQPK
jgi:membrane protein